MVSHGLDPGCSQFELACPLSGIAGLEIALFSSKLAQPLGLGFR